MAERSQYFKDEGFPSCNRVWETFIFYEADEKKALYMSLLLKKFGIMYIISDKKKIILTNSKKEVGNGKRMLETGEYVVSFAGGNG
jgi:hypothetical protein